ncbi:hypothetical protein [Haloarchaeobius sp. TZWSO28]|uniref:hypothetical protein n=1 Tax=Haloarchaeobius sp. TZWSO28 TaxID=3446119 RepID=UPI003EB6DA62
MPCPVCGGTEAETVNVRVPKQSAVSEFVGSTWDGQNVARCDDCGVLYDHRIADATGTETNAGESTSFGEPTNCPDCGSRNPPERDTCTYCDTPLDR